MSRSIRAIRKAWKTVNDGKPIPVQVVLLDNHVAEELSARQSGYVYVLWHQLPDGTRIPYIGETGTTLRERKASHIYQARSRYRQGQTVNRRGLYHAILMDIANGLNPEETFQIEPLSEIKGSVKDRKLAEAAIYQEWVSVGTHPVLYNIAADGGYHSGGMGNRTSCLLVIDETEFEYTSMSAMLRDVAEALGCDLKGFSSRFRQRVSLGWDYAEALELAVKVDGRHTDVSLAREEIKQATGKAKTGIKWKEVGAARRARGIVNPIIDQLFQRGMTGHAELMLKAKAERIPLATRVLRMDQIRSGEIPAATAEEVIAYCCRPPKDRRKMLSITLPDGTTSTMGINEWAKNAGELAKRFGISEVLSFSGIKGRLRRVLEAKSPRNEDLLFAIGLRQKKIDRVGVEQLGIKLTKRNRYDGKPHAK